MDALSLLVTDTFGAATAATVDPSQGPQKALFLKSAWKDALKAQLTEGWRKLEQAVPSQAKAIQILADTSAEQADAALLGSFDTMIGFIAEKEKRLGGAERAEASALLSEMKSSLASRQGQIDPSSSQAFALLDQIVGGAPISAGFSAFRKKVVSDLRSEFRSSSAFRRLTDLYYRLDAPLRAVGTVLLAGAGGAAWVAQNVSFGPGGSVTVNTFPKISLPRYGTRIALDAVGVGFGSGELERLAGSVKQNLGTSGLAATAAADYKKGNPLYASGGIQYTKHFPEADTRLTASTTVDTSFTPASTQLTSRIEASKALGKRRDLDLSAYAQAQAAAGKRPETEAGVTLTQRFGQDREAKRAARAVQREARRLARGNPAVVRRLTGRLPWLQRLFKPKKGEPIVPQPYLAPTPASPPLSPVAATAPWPWIFGIVAVGGVGWWGWRAWSSRSSA